MNDNEDSRSLKALRIGLVAAMLLYLVLAIGTTCAMRGETVQSVSTPLPVPYPGFWHLGVNALYYPCNVVPYLTYPQPDTGFASYVRFDYQVMRVSGTHNVPSGQGGAGHVFQYYDNVGRIIAVSQQFPNSGHFPYPTTMMLNPLWVVGDPAYQDAGAYYQTFNNPPFASPSEALYSARIGNTTEWINGNIPAMQVAKQQQCSAPPAPTKTPTPQPTAVPTGVPTCPTQTPCTCLTQTAVPRTATRTNTTVPKTPVPSATPHLGPAPTKSVAMGGWKTVRVEYPSTPNTTTGRWKAAGTTSTPTDHFEMTSGIFHYDDWTTVTVGGDDCKAIALVKGDLRFLKITCALTR